jgi:hypothetical protein
MLRGTASSIWWCALRRRCWPTKTKLTATSTIIRGGRGALMVVEFPSALCTVGSLFAAQMDEARRKFLLMMHRHIARLRFTGVIFFDKVHGQTGGAPNGVELHPVLQVDESNRLARR